MDHLWVCSNVTIRIHESQQYAFREYAISMIACFYFAECEHTDEEV